MKPKLAGFLFGDGWTYYDRYSRNYLVGFTQSHKNLHVKEYYKKLLEEEAARKVREHECDIYVSLKRLYYELKFVKEHPLEYFRSLTLKEKLEFIEGLIDAEAHVESKRIRIYNKNVDLLTEIKATLELIGVKSYLYKEDVYVLEIKGQHLKILLSKLNPIKYKLHSHGAARPSTRA